VSLPAVYVSVSYRLSPAHRHPAQLEDCLAALAWVHRNITQHGGSPDRLFIGGHSAGGHLAALVALRRDLYGPHGLPGDVIKACFPVSGAFGFDNEPCAKLGAPLFAKPEDRLDASPLAHVAGNRTPFFVAWAENDGNCAVASNPEFVAALRAQPGRVESHVFPLLDHFSINIAMMLPDNLWVRTLRAWMAGDAGTAPVGVSETRV
jgi:acetyl esterase/lipase